MKPLQTSSGDLNADRRADYAEMLLASGDHAAAAELLLGALELAPHWAMGWFRLGEMQEASGRLDLAAQAWTMSLKLDPTDRQGAALKLQLIGKAPVSAAPPSAFVETLFDHYAETFEEMLVGKLDYRLPEFLEQMIRKARPGRFRLALDLGCGTGLMGERLRPIVDRLEGIDISASMLKKARAKGIYDTLTKADLQAIFPLGRKADLVTSADVLIYVGALEGLVGPLPACSPTAACLPSRSRAWQAAISRCSRRGAMPIRTAMSGGLLEANGLSILALEPRPSGRIAASRSKGWSLWHGRLTPLEVCMTIIARRKSPIPLCADCENICARSACRVRGGISGGAYRMRWNMMILASCLAMAGCVGNSMSERQDANVEFSAAIRHRALRSVAGAAQWPGAAIPSSGDREADLLQSRDGFWPVHARHALKAQRDSDKATGEIDAMNR